MQEDILKKRKKDDTMDGIKIDDIDIRSIISQFPPEKQIEIIEGISKRRLPEKHRILLLKGILSGYDAIDFMEIVDTCSRVLTGECERPSISHLSDQELMELEHMLKMSGLIFENMHEEKSENALKIFMYVSFSKGYRMEPILQLSKKLQEN